MKKIFTLLTMALLAIGAQAQTTVKTISFGTKESPATLTSSFSDGQFVLTRTDNNNKHVIDDNKAYFGTAEAQVKFETRLKSGGKSDSNNKLSLTIPFAGTLRVYARSASGSATDRNVIITQNSNELYNDVVKDADAISVDMEENISEDNATGATKVFPVISIAVEAGSADITFPKGALNFYAFELEFEGTEQAIDPEFSLTKTEIYTDETSQIIVTGKSDLDGLTMSDLDYDGDVIDIDDNGVITPLSVGTTTITFTTDAVEGMYNAGEASLTITVKEAPAAPEFGQWNFSDEAFYRYGTITEDKTISGLTLTNGLTFDTNNKEMDGYSFTHRLKFNKDAKENYRSVHFTTEGACNITIYGMSGNSSATDRNLIVTSGTFDGTELYNAQILGDKLYKVTLKVEEATTIYVYSNNAINLYGIFVAEPAESHAATTWDFTQALSSADEATLSASPWTYDEEASPARYKNTETLTEKNVQVSLGLELTDGLKFTSTSSDGLTADKVRIFPAKYLSLNGEKHQIVVEGLAKDDEVSIRFASAAEEGAEGAERGFNVSNSTPESVMSSSNADIVEAKFTATADGNMFFTTTGGVYVYAITINAELPEYTPTGIRTINAETVSNGAIYNLSGQRVDENYRGVVIKNGKKQIQK